MRNKCKEETLQEKHLTHVLLIYRQMIPSVRLCGHCQMEYLAKEKRLEYRTVQEMRIKNSDLNWADIVLLGRLDSWYENQLTKKLHEAGKYLVYIIDDDLLNIPSEISSAAHYGRKETQAYIRSMIELSDAILSPSPLLLEKYARDGRKAILIEEPAIHPSQFRPHDPNQPIKIGFAGSIDRVSDIEGILKEALLKIKTTYGDHVQFEFFGAIPSFAEELDAKCIPYCNSYDIYREKLDSLNWDIGLAPMPDTPFHACKHYNKFVEYAAAGVVGVFSAVMPYTRMKAMNMPARFCKNEADAWYEAICDLLDHPQERERLRMRCEQTATTLFSSDKTSKVFETILNESKLNPKMKRIISVQDVKIQGIMFFVLEKCQMYSWKLPIVFIQKILRRQKK